MLKRAKFCYPLAVNKTFRTILLETHLNYWTRYFCVHRLRAEAFLVGDMGERRAETCNFKEINQLYEV